MTITAPECRFDGFSKLASWVASYRLERHLPTRWRTLWSDDRYERYKVAWPKSLADLRTADSGDQTEVVFAHAEHLILPANNDSVIVTGLSNSALSKDALEILKQYRRTVFPDIGQARVAATFGIKNPTWAYPPTDSRIYHSRFRRNQGQTFGFVAKSKAGLQLGLDVWFEAFPNVQDVYLKIKLEPGITLPKLNDARITTTKGWLDAYLLADWYRSLDCFLSTSCGRYFDWHAEQAVHCGTPTIGTNWNVSYGAEGCSTKRGRAMDIAKAVDWMRLCHADPVYFASSVGLEAAKMPDEYAHEIHTIVQCTDTPPPSDTLETPETSSTPCPSCGG